MTDQSTPTSGGALTRIEYNDTIVRLFILATTFWGLVGMAAGVLIASQLSFHWMNFDTSWLTFGRLRPLHTNAAIFAFVGNMMFAGIYHSTQRLVKARLASDFLSHLHFWGWQAIIVAAAITLPLGFSRGKEYAELIWPINIAVVIIWVVFGVNFFWTLARRNERTLYVAIWFYIATIVTVAMLYIVNHLSIPTGLLHSYPIFGGVQDALVQWWYGHNAVAFFLTTPILGIMYYYMPKAAGRPVYSYRLSVVHFWSLVFVYIWAGPHHLLNTALPDWLQSLGMIFSLMLWAPSWGGMLNGLLTLRGAWHKLRDDPVLKFLAAGVTFYGMSTFEGPLLAIKSVNALAHYTDWIIGHVHSGTLGWNGFMTAGVFYWLVPRLWGTKLHSQNMANLHFWLGMVGILLYISSMWVSGIMQGLMLNAVNPDGTLAYFNYLDALNSARIMMHTRLFGGLLYLVGFGLLGWNLYKTIRSGSPVKETVEVYQAKSDREKDLGIIGTFWNAPVLYCLAVTVVACAWAFGNRIVSFLSFIVLLLLTFGFLYDLKRFSKRWGEWYERLLASAMPFTILTLLAVVIGGAIQIIPTALTTERTTSIDGVSQHLYTPLELAGRDLYIREGCYNCHTQMIRPFVSEVVRYGRDGGYSKLGESMYDYPFQWGSKRTGPDLHRVGGKYGNDWHFRHMWDPRDTSPGSNMPSYTWLFTSVLDTSDLPSKISVLRRLGVPFPDLSPEEIEASVKQQAQTIAADLATKDLKANPDREIIALIAYLQQLGIPAKTETNPAEATAQAQHP